LLREENTVFTQSRTGHVASRFSAVHGMPYVFKVSKRNRATMGAVNGARGDLVGYAMAVDDRDRLIQIDLADDEARVLERLPLAMCMKLDDPSLMRGRRIGNLAYGVVPVEPDLVRFDVNVKKVNKPWYEAACK
jgi:hypothetical protein